MFSQPHEIRETGDSVTKTSWEADLDAPSASPTIYEELGLKRVDVENLYKAMDYLAERENAVEYRSAKRYLRQRTKPAPGAPHGETKP